MIKTLRPMSWLAGLALSMAGLSGCAGFTSAVDDEQARCPDVTPPDHPQPFDAVNATRLCGHDDWRLPQAFELHSLLEPRKNCPGTCIDQGYFPNTASGGYWSSSPFDGFACHAWGIYFELGDASGANKNTPLHVRLVRGKWLIPAASE